MSSNTILVKLYLASNYIMGVIREGENKGAEGALANQKSTFGGLTPLPPPTLVAK